MSDEGLIPLRPCPICGKPSVLKYRPFCSKRCADVDLGRWLGEVYSVPVKEENDDESDIKPLPTGRKDED